MIIYNIMFPRTLKKKRKPNQKTPEKTNKIVFTQPRNAETVPEGPAPPGTVAPSAPDVAPLPMAPLAP